MFRPIQNYAKFKPFIFDHKHLQDNVLRFFYFTNFEIKKIFIARAIDVMKTGKTSHRTK